MKFAGNGQSTSAHDRPSKAVRRALRRRQEFIDRFKGTPAHRITCALDQLTSGISWSGCSKRHLADSYALGQWDSMSGVLLVDLYRKVCDLYPGG